MKYADKEPSKFEKIIKSGQGSSKTKHASISVHHPGLTKRVTSGKSKRNS